MQEVKELKYIYNTDEIVMRKGMVVRVVLFNDEVRWITCTGSEIGLVVADLLEKRFNTVNK